MSVTKEILSTGKPPATTPIHTIRWQQRTSTTE